MKKTDSIFWKDSYISQKLLEAHLSQDTDGASRTIPTIEKTIKFIEDIVPPNLYPKVLDLGCVDLSQVFRQIFVESVFFFS